MADNFEKCSLAPTNIAALLINGETLLKFVNKPKYNHAFSQRKWIVSVLMSFSCSRSSSINNSVLTLCCVIDISFHDENLDFRVSQRPVLLRSGQIALDRPLYTWDSTAPKIIFWIHFCRRNAVPSCGLQQRWWIYVDMQTCLWVFVEMQAIPWILVYADKVEYVCPWYPQDISMTSLFTILIVQHGLIFQKLLVEESL